MLLLATTSLYATAHKSEVSSCWSLRRVKRCKTLSWLKSNVKVSVRMTHLFTFWRHILHFPIVFQFYPQLYSHRIPAVLSTYVPIHRDVGGSLGGDEGALRFRLSRCWLQLFRCYAAMIIIFLCLPKEKQCLSAAAGKKKGHPTD
jgi:hypothetical protein